jgi:hypothetical protein
MKVRPLDAIGDYTLGQPFLSDSPEAVAQIISTRLKLWAGEWFLDSSAGTPYLTQVLGERAVRNPDAAIKARILSTPGVIAITEYSSTFYRAERFMQIEAQVQTAYGSTPLSIPLSFSTVPPA